MCVLMRLSQLAVYHADALTPLDVPPDDLLDDYVDAPALDAADDVTSRPMNFRSSRDNKRDS